MNDPNTRDDIRQVVSGPPQGYFVVMPARPDDSDFNLAALVGQLLAGWRVIVLCGLLGGVVAAVIALNTRPVYRATVKAVLVDPSEVGGVGGLRNQLGGLAALAGLEVGGGAGRKQEAYATLVSGSFARDFIVSENLKPVLFAERWDAAAKGWRAGETEPTLEQAVDRFMKRVNFVTLDLRTGMVDVAMEWYSPDVAATWANLAVARANERVRAEARKSAERSVEFLHRELAKTGVVELREAINRLIEIQINNAMLANVQTEYAFRVIDPAVAPEKRVRPKRTVMALTGGVVGGILGALFVIARQRFRRVDPRHETSPNKTA
jgi:LPS O-antigen subunit length determinant protein (WzzB/FepE family)